MRLIVVEWLHGTTTKSRSTISPASACSRAPNPRYPRNAPGDGHSAAGRVEDLVGTNRALTRGGASNGAASSSRFPRGSSSSQGGAQEMGRSASILNDGRGRGGVPQTMDGASPSWWDLGVVAYPGCAGTALGSSSESLRGLPI